MFTILYIYRVVAERAKFKEEAFALSMIADAIAILLTFLPFI